MSAQEQRTKAKCLACLNPASLCVCSGPTCLDKDALIARLTRERDQYKQQAEWNAQTVIRQANEIRRMQNALANELTAEAQRMGMYD